MTRYAQLVVGPAGSGKSTYCNTIVRHGEACRRQINVVNLDPAAERFDYEPIADIRELIHVDDAMEDEELHFGPNGALVFCMEYFIENPDWLQEKLGEDTDDYVLFDCPGQIELYTHLNVMRRLVDLLHSWDFRVAGVFLLDAQFLVDASKYFAGVMTALSTMVTLEIPHVNVISKMDLLHKRARKQIAKYLEPDAHLLLEDEVSAEKWGEKYMNLNRAIGKLIDDYSLVQFVPLNSKSEESVGDLLIIIDRAIQYGEDLDVKIRDFDEPERDPEFENDGDDI